jgi:phosphoglycerate dehydrogenase-like enzyme
MDCRVWLRQVSTLAEGGIDALQQRFPNVQFSQDVVPEDYARIDVVFTSKRLEDETAAQLSSLKWIHTTYGGGASFLTPSVVARAIPVTCSRGVQAEPLSEFTEACVLAFTKKLPLLSRLKEDRQWDEDISLDTLSGKIAGLLGLGAVGSAVAQRLHKQGMKVHAIRRKIHEIPPYVEHVYSLDQLDKILSVADFLIIGLPALDEIKGLIGEKELRSMKPESVIINLVTRGVIEDAALVKALTKGWIAGAACNVFETNPLPENAALWDAPNLIISPSIAQGDSQRWQKLEKVFAENLGHYLQGTPMINIVDAGEA